MPAPVAPPPITRTSTVCGSAIIITSSLIAGCEARREGGPVRAALPI